mmetsp:Transcript_2407/g.7646  ORF Transcript_2407/g.7646 Transcript_2407/m.7646 type:complete len:271 (+) Transcript_2407:424-1236(+)
MQREMVTVHTSALAADEANRGRATISFASALVQTEHTSVEASVNALYHVHGAADLELLLAHQLLVQTTVVAHTSVLTARHLHLDGRLPRLTRSHVLLAGGRWQHILGGGAQAQTMVTLHEHDRLGQSVLVAAHALSVRPAHAAQQSGAELGDRHAVVRIQRGRLGPVCHVSPVALVLVLRLLHLGHAVAHQQRQLVHLHCCGCLASDAVGRLAEQVGRSHLFEALWRGAGCRGVLGAGGAGAGAGVLGGGFGGGRGYHLRARRRQCHLVE